MTIYYICGIINLPFKRILYKEENFNEIGRIVIPVELRRKFGIDIKDSMEIYTEDNCIILKKYEPSCIFCGDAKNIFQFNGKNICPECAKKINGYVAE